MKRAGWLGFLMIGAGGLMIWSGFQGVTLVAVFRSILNNEPLPRTDGATPQLEATPGSSGGTGFQYGDEPQPSPVLTPGPSYVQDLWRRLGGGGSIVAAPDAGAGSGASGGGGGGW